MHGKQLTRDYDSMMWLKKVPISVLEMNFAMSIASMLSARTVLCIGPDAEPCIDLPGNVTHSGRFIPIWPIWVKNESGQFNYTPIINNWSVVKLTR
jgi:hypothetical protein